MKNGKAIGLIMVVMLLVSLAVMPVAAQIQPCLFSGTVSLDGSPVANGTVIRARLADNTLVGTATTEASEYGMMVIQVGGMPYDGATVNFYVVSGGNEYLGGTSTWNQGGNKVLNLVAVSTVPCENNPAVAVGLATIYANLGIVYCQRQGEGAGGWTVYNPAWASTHPDWNTLSTLYRGRGYWMQLTANSKLTYGNWNTVGNPLAAYDLLAGWNMIGWMGC